MFNRQWLLQRRPTGLCAPEDFRYLESEYSPPALKKGEFLVHNLAFLCAPTIRNWMDEPAGNYIPSISLGGLMRGPCAARVIASANPDFPVGSRICTIGEWQDYGVISPADALVRIIPEGFTSIEALGPVGMNALTAYFGLREVGRPQRGETLLVSGAAGSVGMNVAQIGRILGCRVIGVAGGANKCEWLIENSCVDHCIDYKSEDVAAKLASLCPEGVDVYFDNVGGRTLQAAVDNMARFGRIILCGQISGYTGEAKEHSLGNLMRLVYGSVRMEGFLASNYIERFPDAMSQLAAWIKDGLIAHREDVRFGMDRLPLSLNALFEGSNAGTLIVQIDESANLDR